MTQNKSAYLLLEDRTVFRGKSFGAEKEVVGEVVFNTGMTGYQEVFSDPSYCGQIITFTYPLIGNYGINRDDFEALHPHVEALIVKEHCTAPHHWRKVLTLEELLQEKGIPGIYGVDTRALTRRLRMCGTMKGMLIIGREPKAEDHARLEQLALPRDQVARVSTKNPYHCPGRGKRVVVLDFGVKAGILRELTKRQCDIRVVPYDTPAEEILGLKPDGILLSNGPGDPQDVHQAPQTIKSLLGQVPIFGICLGHQLLALACGATTEKMVFGHRGCNHPVQDVESKQTFLSSQNHGYTVATESLTGTGLKVTFINVNDQTVEGLAHKSLPAFSVQFHPEAAPGPYDTRYLFDQFMEMMEAFKTKKNSTRGAISYAT
ncbi:carbamoyl-phosphate synthase pyrimidine-specific small chain [Caldalkalibacillus thermarum]|uniref:carbamoyl phosphate synthase small subunit n=1 Tax=Caldalkalibacillus thermarum TaxID=296745 RepID=UPI00166AD925|nr:carbamoyl phosphate synthase small subunit [Caldalkalibacillus thermarum]GGK13989.1 carbamoyl-phosphate synthase pyrimidine-specific small chain [Caldalkalibacillus thermarum]